MTEDGDLLRAKFKAFKFPESNFVLFRGVVNVCLDKCQGVDCANGQTGFGKRRRDVSDAKTSTKNKVYEVSMSTVVRVGEEKVEKSTESRREKDTLVVEEAIVADVIHPDELALAALSEEFGVYKFVDFATGKEGREGKREKRNVATSLSSDVTILLLCATMILQLRHLWN